LRVTFRQSGFAGRVLELDQPVLRFGREPACEILFDENTDRVVSRVHGELRWDGDDLKIFPNGERAIYRRGQRLLAGDLLLPGDLIELAGAGGPGVEVHYQRAEPEAATQADLAPVQVAPAVPSAEERTPPLGVATVPVDETKTKENPGISTHDAPTFRLSPEQAAAILSAAAPPIPAPAVVPEAIPVATAIPLAEAIPVAAAIPEDDAPTPPSGTPIPPTHAFPLETAMQGGTAVLNIAQLRAAALATAQVSSPGQPAPPIPAPAPVGLAALPVATPDLGPKKLDLPTRVIHVPSLGEPKTAPELAPVAPLPPAQRGPYQPAATAVPQQVPKEVAELATAMMRAPMPAAPPAVAPAAVPTPVGTEDATSMRRVALPTDDAPTPPAGLPPLPSTSIPPPPKPPPQPSMKVEVAPEPVAAPKPAENKPNPERKAVPFGTKLSSQPPPEVIAAAARLAESAKSLSSAPKAEAKTEPPPHAATQMMPAHLPSESVGSTQFIRIDELPQAAVTARERRRWLPVALAAAAALLLVIGAWFIWSKVEHTRRAEVRAQRIEALRKDLEAMEAAGKASAPEFARLEQELAKEEKAQAEETGTSAPVRAPRAKVVDDGAAMAAALAKQQAEEASKEAARLTKFGDARALWAKVKAAELNALSKPAAQRAVYWAARKDVLAEYDAFVNKELGAPSDALIAEALDAFGESSATVPAGFLSEVKAELRALTQDATQKELFVAAVKGGEENAYSPAVTAALADQGLPVELYFFAYVVGRLDPRGVGAADARGVPKGMFRLYPKPAASLGLKAGPLVEAAEFDAADERHLHEKESKLVARLMRDVHRNGAAGSVLLVVAAFDGGDVFSLSGMKSRAGLDAADKDPANVSFWKLLEAGAIPSARRQVVVRTVAAAVAGMHPDRFGLGFAAPFKHVAVDAR